MHYITRLAPTAIQPKPANIGQTLFRSDATAADRAPVAEALAMDVALKPVREAVRLRVPLVGIFGLAVCVTTATLVESPAALAFSCWKPTAGDPFCEYENTVRAFLMSTSPIIDINLDGSADIPSTRPSVQGVTHCPLGS